MENFGFTEQTLFSKFQFNSLLKINSNRYIKKSILKSLFRDYKFTKDNDDILNQTNKKIFLNGYWKDTKYIENSTEWLTSSIKKNEIIKDAWKSTLDENRAMIHIRRGDFIKDDRELKVSYYEKSINLLRRQNSQLKFDIFTDDEQWVQDQSIFSLSDNIYAQQSGKNINNEIPGIDGKDDSEETIKTFSQMLNYKHFIAGNSSFAFWAAFIRSDMTSLVTVPKPWFRNNDHPTLHKAHWNIINNT